MKDAAATEAAAANEAAAARRAAKEARQVEWEMGAAEGARLRQERTAKLTPPLTPPPTTTPANTPPAAEDPGTMLRRKIRATAYMKGVMARQA
jgi:hypothetical protein